MSAVVITDRPMSEYESALFHAVVALGGAMLTDDADKEAVRARLSEIAESSDADGRRNEAATLRMLVKFLCDPPEFFVPGAGPN